MPTTEKYETLAGETIRYPKPTPKLQKFLARIVKAVDDDSVGPGALDALIFGKDNPLLDHTVNKGTELEGVGAITKETFANPVYHVMQDLAHRKRVQFAGVERDHSKEVFTKSVADVIDMFDGDISADRVRRLCRANTFAHVSGPQGLMIDPRSVEAYIANRATRRGPKKKPALTCRYGSEPGKSFSVKALDLVKGDTAKKGAVRMTDAEVPEFETAAVKFSGKDMQRCFIIERASRRKTYNHGHFFIEGMFKIVEKVNGAAAASRRFKTFEPA